ncbi:MAG: hypothetical protein QOH90_819 [Actinomycetota bacterium]|nr:hypothetical protein [Actinomycetota bacterium]
MERNVRSIALAAGTLLILGGTPLGAAPTAAATTPTCFGKKATIIVKAGQGTVKGTNHADVIVGSSKADDIRGRGGKDRICGKGGDDALDGGGGNDKINGQGDSGFGDLVVGEGGDDLLKGGGKATNSSDSRDSTFYLSAKKGVKVNLATGVATGQGKDKLVGVEDVIGSQFNDRLIGNGKANFFFGFEGNDVLDVRGGRFQVVAPGNGDDTVKGPAGQRTALTYEDVAGPVTIDLAAKDVTGGAGNDALTNITDAFGSNGDDTITGTNGGEQLGGYAGNDTINTGGNPATLDDPYTFIANLDFDIVFGDDGAFDIASGGDDTITGGTGVNVSCYCGATTGVTVDLQAGTATGGGGNDTLSSIQGIIGSPFDDTIRGSGVNEIFEVTPGTDTIDGRGGEDVLESFDNTGLTADLAAGTGSGESPAFINGQFDLYPTTLALANIEDIWASFEGPDSLGGSNAANRFYSFGGNDTLTGQQQNDFLDAGLGTDSADGGAGTDTCIDAETATACESTGPVVARRTRFAPKAFTLHHLRWTWRTRY